MSNEHNPKKYLNWIWGENNISQPEPQHYIVRLEPPAVSIRFNYSLAMFATYEEFYKNIADVQFLCGHRPEPWEVEEILTDAWNFLALEERKLENDVDNTDFDDEFM